MIFDGATWQGTAHRWNPTEGPKGAPYLRSICGCRLEPEDAVFVASNRDPRCKRCYPLHTDCTSKGKP
jgi:hypothetical protein